VGVRERRQTKQTKKKKRKFPKITSPPFLYLCLPQRGLTPRPLLYPCFSTCVSDGECNVVSESPLFRLLSKPQRVWLHTPHLISHKRPCYVEIYRQSSSLFQVPLFPFPKISALFFFFFLLATFVLFWFFRLDANQVEGINCIYSCEKKIWQWEVCCEKYVLF